MKVFISWSGPVSEKIGAAIKNWLPGVLQSVHPYFTPTDLEKGTRWFVEISKELSESKVGIICVTGENINSDWIQFEAGALSRTIEKSRVCPVLLGVKPTDLSGPLKQFQATEVEREDFWKLINVINGCLEGNKLPEKTMRTVFDKWWPDLESELGNIARGMAEPTKPVREDRELLEEILQLVRRQELQNARAVSRRITPESIVHLLKGYLRLHDEQANHSGGYQHTLDLLREIHGPLEQIISKQSNMPLEAAALFEQFRVLSYKVIDKEESVADENEYEESNEYEEVDEYEYNRNNDDDIPF